MSTFLFNLIKYQLSTNFLELSSVNHDVIIKDVRTSKFEANFANFLKKELILANI